MTKTNFPGIVVKKIIFVFVAIVIFVIVFNEKMNYINPIITMGLFILSIILPILIVEFVSRLTNKDYKYWKGLNKTEKKKSLRRK